MELIVDDKDEEPTSYNKTYNKIIGWADNIGNFIYDGESAKQTTRKIISYIKRKPTERPDSKQLADVVNACIRKEKENRRLIGLSIIGIIILSVVAVILYVFNMMIDILFQSMEWWLIAILMVGIIVPLFAAIAYLIAKGDY